MQDRAPAASEQRTISEQEVLAYLQDHPGLMDLVTPASTTGNVVDFQAAKAERLAERTRSLSDELAQLLRNARRNTLFLKRAEQAMCSLLEAESRDDLLTRINQELPALFRFDVAGLCLSLDRGKLFQAAAGRCYWSERDDLERLLAGQNCRLLPTVDVEARLFGKSALNVRSAALVRLDLPRLGLCGVLGFGSETPGFVAADDGEDVLRFLGLVVERCLQLWVLIDLAHGQ